MLVSDILHSCTQRDVAQAAVASIGGDFARHVELHADASNQTVGEFAAYHVRQFTRRATERDWRDLTRSMRGEDLALLSGLKIVLTRMMKGGVEPDPIIINVGDRCDA